MPENLRRANRNHHQAPALLRCLKTLQDGNTLIVWKFDRLARSLRDLVSMLDDFHQRGIHFRSLTEEINTGRQADLSHLRRPRGI
jgi:DNA invertase Pin-like site-specific DNA recombinase